MPYPTDILLNIGDLCFYDDETPGVYVVKNKESGQITKGPWADFAALAMKIIAKDAELNGGEAGNLLCAAEHYIECIIQERTIPHDASFAESVGAIVAKMKA
jgi:hypothetical protein